MELRSGVKALNFIKNMFLGEMGQLLPYTPVPTKPLSPEYSGVRLLRETPEQAGIPSELIEKMIREITQNRSGGLHTIMVLRNGKVVLEGGYSPYSTKFWHVTHSLCKTFTGTAIGMLIDDGAIMLDDKICDLFPEKCNFLTSKRTKSITIRHLLTMQSGVNFREMGAVLEKDWVRAFMEAEVVFEPGSKMDYNSMNSYILSAIVSKLTGTNLCDFLQKRLFTPLGFGAVSWDTCPMGITKGGWGMYIFAEDAVKLGQLYLQNGKWKIDGKDKQIISEQWVINSTKSYGTRETGEEYGYHIWPRTKNECYIFNGMFGQYVIIFPVSQIIVFMNAGNEHLFTQCETCEIIIKYMSTIKQAGQALPQNSDALKNLNYTLENLNFLTYDIPLQSKNNLPWYKKIFATKPKPETVSNYPDKAKDICGKKLKFAKNIAGLVPLIMQFTCDSISLGLNEISFEIQSGRLCLLWTEGDFTNKLPLSFDGYAYSCTVINGGSWLTACNAAFVKDEDDQEVLKIRVCFPEQSSARIIKFWFTPSGCILKLDETPAVALAMERVKEEQVALTSIDPTFFKDFGYIEYKVNAVCAPVLKGTWI